MRWRGPAPRPHARAIISGAQSTSTRARSTAALNSGESTSRQDGSADRLSASGWIVEHAPGIVVLAPEGDIAALPLLDGARIRRRTTITDELTFLRINTR